MYETIVEEKDLNGYHKRSLTDHLYNKRVVFLEGEVTETMSSIFKKQLLLLEEKDPTTDIQIYINSPGGSIDAGLSMFDVMSKISPKCNVIVTGMAASMGAFLLAGATGKRFALPNAQIMCHQLQAGTKGTYSEMQAQNERIIKCNQKMIGYMAAFTKKTYEEYDSIITPYGKDGKYFDPKEALDFGLIDEVLDLSELSGRPLVVPILPKETI